MTGLIIVDFPKIRDHLVGMTIPKRDNGNIGRLVEDEIEKLGYTVNRAAGVDLERFGVEVKTRGNGKSSNSICSSTMQDIIDKPYAQSLVCRKMQKQLRVKFDTEFQVIKTVDLFPFDNPEIQKILEKEYELLRNIIIKNNRQPEEYETWEVIKTCSNWGYWEVTPAKQFKFRIPKTRMLQFERMAKQVNLFDLV